jgi:glycosyltransferase involved in cell wall biosynthesis
MKRILYIQHAGALGGSAISLLSLIKELDRTQYEPIIACIHSHETILSFYQQAGIKVFYWPGISDFMHTTGGWYPAYDPLAIPKLFKRLWGFNASIAATRALIEHVQPDIVHLNSLVLPSCAIAANQCGVKLVWHIRESVVAGHFGIRQRWLGKLVKDISDEAIFISSAGRQLLVNDEMGKVIPNFVDFTRFNHAIDGSLTRSKLGLDNEVKIILFLGGRGVIKGIFPLLKAISLVKQQVPNMHLLICGGAFHFSGRLSSRIARTIFPLVGYGTVAQRVDKLMDNLDLHNYVHMLEWCSDIPQMIASCDVLVFPSIEPHFARPVIEAGAMAKPVVASRIGGVEELIQDGETGVLVTPGDSIMLAESLVDVLTNSERTQRMGHNGLIQARQKFEANKNINQIIAIYERIVSNL